MPTVFDDLVSEQPKQTTGGTVFDDLISPPATKEQSGPPEIQLSPYEKYRLEGREPVAGPFGPASPEEVPALADVLKVPGAALESFGTQALRTIRDVLSPTTYLPEEEQSKLRPFKIGPEGISQMTKEEAEPIQPGQPMFQFQRTALQPTPNPLERLIEGATTPGSAVALPFAETTAGRLLFGSMGASGLKDSVSTLLDKTSSADEKREAVESIPLNAAMVLHAAPKGAPNAKSVRESPGQLPKEGIQPVTGQGDSSAVVEPKPPEQPQPVEPGKETQTQITATDTTTPVPEAQMPQGATETGLRPAVRLVGGKVVVGDAGATHADIIKAHDLKATDIDQRGFVDQSGKFQDRETAAATTQIPTETEPGRLHSTDLPEAKTDTGPSFGAAKLGEEAVIPKGTSLKNATAELEREGLGLQDVPEKEVTNLASSWQKSADTLQKDPQLPEKLVGDMLQNPDRGLSGDESMVLLRYKRQLLNAINDAAEKTHIGDRASRDAAQALHTKLVGDLGNFLDAVNARGSSAGLEFRMRQALVKEDYTFESQDDFNRFSRNTTGKDLTPAQADSAAKVASKVKDASDAEKRALDAANKAVRENAVRIAKEETKGNVEDVDRQQKVYEVQEKAAKDALDAANKAVKDAVKQKEDAAEKSRVAASKSERSAAKVQEKSAAKAVKAADDLARKAAVEHAKAQRKALGDPIKTVWDKVRKYIDKGESDFRDISQKVATELGLKVDTVRRIMAQDKNTKRLLDDAWNKQQKAQLLRQEAKRWVIGQETPELAKLVKNLPRFMFGVKISGHGAVALGTHAPLVAFRPNYWNVYFPAYKTMYKMVGNKGFYQAQVDALMRRDNYIRAKRAGLVNDPTAFEDYTNPEIAKYLTGGKAGARGFTVLKILRQDMFDKQWSKLPQSMRTYEMAHEISNGINHDTGVAKLPAGISKHAALGLFAPRLEASRFMTLVGDPARGGLIFLKRATGHYVSPAEWHFAMEQVKTKATIAATMYGLLQANQQILNASGSKQQVNFSDPFKSDWLKFKVGGMDFAYGNAMVSMARLPVELVRLIAMDRKTRNLIYDDETFWTTLGRYARTQFSPFSGTLTDLALGSDYASRPLPRKLFGLAEQNAPVPKRLQAQGFEQYTWPEYLTQQFSPIPAQEAIKEVWRHGFGLTDEQVKALGKALIISSVMGGTGGRLTPDYEIEKPEPLR